MSIVQSNLVPFETFKQLAEDQQAPVVILEAASSSSEDDIRTVLVGAHRVLLERDLSGAADGDRGSRPFPEKRKILDTLAKWGVDSATRRVLVYANPSKDLAAAARAWLLLKWAGVNEVFVLDGGVASLKVYDLNPNLHEPSGEIAKDTFSFSGWPLLETADVADFAHGAELLDARPAQSFQQGHIPGAQSVPLGALFTDGRLTADRDLKEGLKTAAAKGEIGAYCGGGVAAAGLALALTTLDINTKVYVGSWSAWTADAERPIAKSADVSI